MSGQSDEAFFMLMQHTEKFLESVQEQPIDPTISTTIDEFLELREIGTADRPYHGLYLKLQEHEIHCFGVGASKSVAHKLIKYTLAQILESYRRKLSNEDSTRAKQLLDEVDSEV